MIKNILKYSVCTAVTLAVTGGVILMPYSYYLVDDAKIQNDYEIDEFTLTQAPNNISLKTAAEVLQADDSIHIETGITLTDDELLKKINSLLYSLEKHLTPNSLAYQFVQLYDKNSQKTINAYSSHITIGRTSEDTPVSISTADVEFETNTLYICILFDLETDKIYQLNINLKENLKEKENVSSYDYYTEGDEPISKYNSFKLFYEKVQADSTGEAYKNACETAYNDILRYWNENDIQFALLLDDTAFSFYFNYVNKVEEKNMTDGEKQ